MRTSGVTEVRARAAEVLVDGLAQGQRVCDIARGDDLAAHLEPEPVSEPAIARLNSLHPANNARCTPFRLHATECVR
jgi:hypothetical protein